MKSDTVQYNTEYAPTKVKKIATVCQEINQKGCNDSQEKIDMDEMKLKVNLTVMNQ